MRVDRVTASSVRQLTYKLQFSVDPISDIIPQNPHSVNKIPKNHARVAHRSVNHPFVWENAD
jgi:hypothetical protein